ncbi:hypothetical protein BH09PSE5_BH09PSE5_00360 [soil metagenome]
MDELRYEDDPLGGSDTLDGMKKTPPGKKSEPVRTVARGEAKVSAKAAPKVARKATAASRSAAAAASGVEDIRDAVSRLKRERIIATAVDLFYGNGFGNTTLDAVAEKMNVTKPFIYSHFSSKNELLAEICSHGIRSSLDALNRVVASDVPATEKLQTLTRHFMLAVLENQAHIAIYNREEKHLSADAAESINAMRREFDRKFVTLIQEGVSTGEFVVEDVKLTSLAIGGIVSWSYVWYRPDGRLTSSQVSDLIGDLVLSMVQAKPAKRRRPRSAAIEAA